MLPLFRFMELIVALFHGGEIWTRIEKSSQALAKAHRLLESLRPPPPPLFFSKVLINMWMMHRLNAIGYTCLGVRTKRGKCARTKIISQPLSLDREPLLACFALAPSPASAKATIVVEPSTSTTNNTYLFLQIRQQHPSTSTCDKAKQIMCRPSILTASQIFIST